MEVKIDSLEDMCALMCDNRIPTKKKLKTIVTEYTEICSICGKPRQCDHHLIYGSYHKLADKDGLILPMCNDCHNMGDITRRIHGNSMAENLSKIVGQLAWEKEYYRNGQQDKAREAFRKRYGVSYL